MTPNHTDLEAALDAARAAYYAARAILCAAALDAYDDASAKAYAARIAYIAAIDAAAARAAAKEEAQK